jgi:hypothetical protein
MPEWPLRVLRTNDSCSRHRTLICKIRVRFNNVLSAVHNQSPADVNGIVAVFLCGAIVLDSQSVDFALPQSLDQNSCWCSTNGQGDLGYGDSITPSVVFTLRTAWIRNALRVHRRFTLRLNTKHGHRVVRF